MAVGLEFEYVFVVNAVSQRFPGSRRSEPFEIPEELTREIYPEGDFHLQEERRLFYVANARSKKIIYHLQINMKAIKMESFAICE